MKKRSMVVVDLQNTHGMTAGTKEGVKAKRECNGIAPAIEGTEDLTFTGMNRIAKVRHLGVVFGIKAIIADHFEMFFRDMLGEACHEIKNGDGFRDQFFVFMAVVMERNRLADIRVNT